MSAPRITKDWLFWEHPEVDLVRKRERTGSPIVPSLIVIHYGVTSTLEALVAAQRSRGYWAHLSIDGKANPGGANYLIHQALPFNERGSHAGESTWHGRDQCNAFSVGIEIANPGPLIRGTDGQLRTVYGQVWPESDAVEARHRNGGPGNWTHWAAYSDQEMDILVEVCGLLCETYPIEGIAGHDEISPGRKWDPGAAFPMQFLREKFGFIE